MTRWQTTILGTRIDAVTASEALERAKSFLVSGQHQIVTPNSEFVLEASRNPEFQSVLNTADLALPDGFGLVIASRFTPVKIKKTVPGRVFVLHLFAQAEKKGLRVAIVNQVGALSAPEEIETALKRRYPQLKVMVFVTSTERLERAEFVGPIKAWRPALLFTALGAPWQDLWIRRYLAGLPSVRLAMGIGGSLDFLTGKRRAAPAWMQRRGLEWLWRLVSRPRGGQRYYLGLRIRKIFRAVVIFPLVFVFTLNRGRTR